METIKDLKDEIVIEISKLKEENKKLKQMIKNRDLIIDTLQNYDDED
jgi:hypothetical protein